MFELIQTGIPTTVGLASVAFIGYLAGRFGRQTTAASEVPSLRELNRAQTVVRELERIAQEVRQKLAAHHMSVSNFRDRIDDLSNNNEADWKRFAEEAEQLLLPTQSLATQIAQAYDEIRRQSKQLAGLGETRTDVVTRVGNRKCLDETLKTMLGMYGRMGTIFSIAVFDIDHFTEINAERGHTGGDKVLQLLATTLDECSRETDVVARFDGAEFVVVLPGTDLVGAARFGERMRLSIVDRMGITVSAGVAMVGERDTPRAILARADAALYASKAAGRNCVFQHDGGDLRPVTMAEYHTTPEIDGEHERRVANKSSRNLTALTR